jgi:hypothetical protein
MTVWSYLHAYSGSGTSDARVRRIVKTHTVWKMARVSSVVQPFFVRVPSDVISFQLGTLKDVCV